MILHSESVKPVPAVAEYKPLCFLKHQETQPRQHTAETNTHGEDFLRLPTRSHVGVVDLFEDHPGFIVLPHLTGRKERRLIHGLSAGLAHSGTATHPRLYTLFLWFFQDGSKWWKSRQRWLILLQRVIILQQQTYCHGAPSFCFLQTHIRPPPRVLDDSHCLVWSNICWELSKYSQFAWRITLDMLNVKNW